MGKPITSLLQFHRPEWALVATVIALLTYAMPVILEALPAGPPPSPNKPYADLAAFRPHYMREHQDDTTVSLHVTGTSLVALLLLAHPELLGAGVLALQCGFIACAAFRHHDHGLVEAAIVLAVFFLVIRWLRGSTRVALVALVVGYAFAWTGHFFYERNHPATFIYPTYSLICDYIMWAEVLAGISISL